MADWFEFALYALQHTVETVFGLDLGLGFSLGDVEVALLIIGIVATALVVRIGSAASHEVDAAHRINNRRSYAKAQNSHGSDHITYPDWIYEQM